MSVVDLIFSKSEYHIGILSKSGIAVLLGLFSSVCIACLCNSKKFMKVTVKLFGKTTNDEIWRDIFDLKNGSNLKVYEKEKEYYIIGHLKNMEEKGEESWIAISSYSKNSITDDAILEKHDSDQMAIYTVRLVDVDHFEVFN
ncbi:hypothetical protein [Candidatus Weimeria sp. HCP3S3_B5]|uniref:hypothetical protein n=1 Tax=Candidatus Weimeria sp. HCP3S3_B5 TaxID=3438871 RepID=UPI003F8B09D2